MSETDRSPIDRRSVKARRRKLSLARFRLKAKDRDSERRNEEERRSHFDRRDGWVRMSKWASVCLEKLKIAKFLK